VSTVTVILLFERPWKLDRLKFHCLKYLQACRTILISQDGTREFKLQMSFKVMTYKYRETYFTFVLNQIFSVGRNKKIKMSISKAV